MPPVCMHARQSTCNSGPCKPIDATSARPCTYATAGLVLNAIDTVLDNSADEELLRQAYASSAARQTLEH
jgi:hypothetical protein